MPRLLASSRPALRAGGRPLLLLVASLATPAVVVGACSSNSSSSTGFSTHAGSGGNGQGGSGSGNSGAGSPSGTGGGLFGDGSIPDSPVCAIHCSTDHTQVLDCDGGVVVSCTAGQACDLSTGMCSPACTAAVNNKSSVGCDYYATRMEMDYSDQCYAVFVANTWSTPAHINVGFSNDIVAAVSTFGFIPSGTGSSVTYTAYDDTNGLAPGAVAILFLGGSPSSNVPCPSVVKKTAIPNGSLVAGTGVGHSFHITTDVPVVAYQINPYGGGAAAITGASLLLPTSVWDTNYVAITAAPYSMTTMDNPSFNIIAAMDGTMVTVLPKYAITGGGTLPAGAANMPYTFTLMAGEQAQFSQQTDLTGSVIQSNNPVGVMAGNACMQNPNGTPFCDHGEQMLPPVKSLGSEYVAAPFRPRTTGDQVFWRVVGAVDGTTLTYVPSAPPGAPTTLAAGQDVTFNTATAFVVKSQDDSHPFSFFAQMTGAEWSGLTTQGYGDPDIVLGVAPKQYLNDYVFFTDPTYPETNLVVVRTMDPKSMMFQDVTLDCAGALTGWQTVGSYQWTTVDLVRHNFQNQGNCSTGRREMKSSAPFGLWVWGWGSPETQGGTCNQQDLTNFTCYVSYGYPGGMNVSPINQVVINPVSK